MSLMVILQIVMVILDLSSAHLERLEILILQQKVEPMKLTLVEGSDWFIQER